MKLNLTFFRIFISVVALTVFFGLSFPVTAGLNITKTKSKANKATGQAENDGNKSEESSYVYLGPSSKDKLPSPSSSVNSKPNNNPSTSSPAVPSETAKQMTASQKEADYWFDKGALCATYGNEHAAIKYFQKAISLDPQKSKAYFEQGISYGQIGEYTKALELIKNAIELDPQNGIYYYGCGRVHLLAGEQEQALANFKKAAELDDEDAQTYLESRAAAE
jgi:tetratricopeptide (TPR) repeat protein